MMDHTMQANTEHGRPENKKRDWIPAFACLREALRRRQAGMTETGGSRTRPYRGFARAVMFIIAALLAMHAAAFADEVVCKDGRVITGSIIEDTDKQVKIETRTGSVTAVLTIPRSDVVSTRYTAPDLKKLRMQGYGFLAEEKFADAIACFRRIAETEGASAAAWGDLAFACHLGHEDAEAEDAYRRASALEPKGGVYIAALGVLYEETGDEFKAVAEFSEYAALEPENPRSMKLLGIAFMRIGDFDNAETRLLKAARLDPRNEEALLALAHVYAQTGRVKEAAAVYEKFAALSPGKPDAWLLLAVLYEKAEMFADAAGALKEAAGRSPEDRRGALLTRMRMDEYLRRAKESPELVGKINFLGVNPDNAANLDTIIALSKNALEINPGFAPAHTLMGIAYFRAGKFEEAKDEFVRSQSVSHGREELVAVAYENIAAFKILLENNPDAEGNSNFLGLPPEGNAEWRRALQISETAVNLEPAFADARYMAAVALMRLERFRDARAELGEYAKLRPKFTDKTGKAESLLNRLESDWRRRKGF